jgi:hypothetical protein
MPPELLSLLFIQWRSSQPPSPFKWQSATTDLGNESPVTHRRLLIECRTKKP